MVNASRCFSRALAVASAVAMCVAATTVAANGGDRPERRGVTAGAEIRDCVTGERLGTAFLKEQPSDEGVKEVRIVMVVKGLSAGKHAVHIHETAACEPCGAAGGHFDPGPFGFTNPDGNHPYHSGDLVNLSVNHHGVGTLRTRTTRVTLSPGPLSLFDDDGSAFIVHVDPDTYCPDGAEPGCAGGARAACGIIEEHRS